MQGVYESVRARFFAEPTPQHTHLKQLDKATESSQPNLFPTGGCAVRKQQIGSGLKLGTGVKMLRYSFALGIFSFCLMIGNFAEAETDVCSLLGKEPALLSDGETYVENGTAWSQFRSVSDLQLKQPTTKRFIYVVHPFVGDRTGILVIKSNRLATQADADDDKKRVRLVRGPVAKDESCEKPAYFPKSGETVSTQSYEDYHDYPAKDTEALRKEEGILRAFHFEYMSAAKRRCVRTDDDSYDRFPFNRNSNRAQFSYDGDVVNGGLYYPWRLAWRAASPFEGFAEHLTTAMKYGTTGGLACVLFSLPLKPTEYVIRINDIEGREKPPSNRRVGDRRFP